MPTEVKVPTLGESVSEATIGQWLKQPGEAVARDEPIASLDTDPEWEEAWAAEADRREASIASGQASWISGDAALARIEGVGVDALGLQGFQHAGAGHQGHFALGGTAAEQHADFAEFSCGGSCAHFEASV